MRRHFPSSDRRTQHQTRRSVPAALLLGLGLTIGFSEQGFAATRTMAARGVIAAAMPPGQRDEAAERMRQLREIVQLAPRETKRARSRQPEQGQKTVTIDGEPCICCEGPKRPSSSTVGGNELASGVTPVVR